ncbi:MAG TPA: di-heme enzyme [Candidatus Acidoferrales bacterium]|nr:di-heme enzyme [Candidatus Acidoferrales bacterium]
MLCWLTADAVVCARSRSVRDASASGENFRWTKPDWAPTPLVPKDNPMTDAKVRLGRFLFYDKKLSIDQTMSCASCHQQSRAFTDGQRSHLGVNGLPGNRNAMTLTNVAFSPSYTWANPLITSLEKQMLVPLFSDFPLEMGMAGHETELFSRLSQDASYPKLFAEAFPEDSGRIDLRNVTRAIAAFERTLLSFDSPYDRFKHGQPDAISASAKRGEALFFGETLECYHCHDGVNFTDNDAEQGQAFEERGFHNTGLYNEDGNGSYKAWDHGLREVTANPEDEGAFRTPTLRNVAVTAPYMHDGSLPTLEAVIREHYAIKGHSSFSGKGPNPLRSEFIEGFSISDREVRDLVEFLRSLTDQSFLTNPAFSDPNSRVSQKLARRSRFVTRQVSE